MVCVSVCVAVCLAVWLSGCLSVWLSGCLAGWLSVWLGGCLSGWLAVCLAGCLSVWLGGCLSGWVALWVCTWVLGEVWSSVQLGLGRAGLPGDGGGAAEGEGAPHLRPRRHLLGGAVHTEELRSSTWSTQQGAAERESEGGRERERQ